MGTKAYLREFLKYSSLNVLGMIALSCYILADTFFVAQGLGSAGLAALNLAIPVYNIIHGVGLLLGAPSYIQLRYVLVFAFLLPAAVFMALAGGAKECRSTIHVGQLNKKG